MPEGAHAGSVSTKRAPGWSRDDCLAMSLKGEMCGLLGVGSIGKKQARSRASFLPIPPGTQDATREVKG